MEQVMSHADAWLRLQSRGRLTSPSGWSMDTRTLRVTSRKSHMVLGGEGRWPTSCPTAWTCCAEPGGSHAAFVPQRGL
jgi:hypothetical protein